MHRARVFEVDAREFGTIVARAKGALSGRAESRLARRMREELLLMLEKVVNDAIRDGSFPNRSGRAARITQGGARAFGQTLASLRGHIIGPAFLKILEDGGTLEPVNAEALAIPMPYPSPAMRPDGTPVLPGPRSWANIRKTFIYKSKKTGRGYIAYKGAGGRLVLLYMLVESAEFKARKFLERSWERNKDGLIYTFGQLMLNEFERVDLLKRARVTYKGRVAPKED